MEELDATWVIDMLGFAFALSFVPFGVMLLTGI